MSAIRFIVRFNAPPNRDRKIPYVDSMAFEDESAADDFARRHRWGTEPCKVQRVEEIQGEAGIGDHYEGCRRNSALLSAYLNAFRALFPGAYAEITQLERALDSARNTGD